jgi:hypothetical protein
MMSNHQFLGCEPHWDVWIWHQVSPKLQFTDHFGTHVTHKATLEKPKHVTCKQVGAAFFSLEKVTDLTKLFGIYWLQKMLVEISAIALF